VTPQVEAPHEVRIRSVQVWRGSFDRLFVDEDGELSATAMDMTLEEERSISFECECGERFHKKERAVEHLRDVNERLDS